MMLIIFLHTDFIIAVSEYTQGFTYKGGAGEVPP